MSKPIRDTEQQQKVPAAPHLVIDDAVILKLLKACQSLAVAQGRTAFQQYLGQLTAALDDEIGVVRSEQERVQLTHLQRQLRQRHGELERYYCGCVAENFVKFKKKQLNTAIAQDIGSASELELLDNEKLEESIAVSSISQRVNVYYAEPLWALNRRLSLLNSGEKVAEENNPAAPIQLCESLRRTLKLLQASARGKAIAYRVYDEQMFSVAGSLVLEINEYLRTQGVLPHLRYESPSDAVPRPCLADSTGNGTPESDHRRLPEPAENGLAQALLELRSMTGGVGASGQSQSRGSESAALQQVQPDTGATDKNAMQTLDQVGTLFDHMLRDENLPDAVKTLLCYLHTPFLKLAFVDPGFFEQSQHPARLLLNNLAEAGLRWVRDDGSSEFGIYGKIKQVIDRIVRDFDNDVRVIAELLFEFSSYTKDILRRQELMEKRAREKAQGEEKLRAAKQLVSGALRERTSGRELPSAILLLLLQPWSDYLSFVLLRYGEDSDNWHESLAVVDDLLWCIEPGRNAQERLRQQELHHPVLQSLESGLNAIGYDQIKAHQLIESVDNLIQQVMQSKTVEPASAPVRDQLERLAAEKASDAASSPEALTPEVRQMVDNLKMVEFGTWFGFDDGRRLKVAWYNNRTAHYMLVDPTGGRAAMMSGVDMARSMIAGKARVISGSSKPFFDRALENIFQKRSAPAEAR